jgi:hypothetical protein
MHLHVMLFLFAVLVLGACGDPKKPPTPTPPLPKPDISFTFVDDPTCKNTSDRWSVSANKYAWPDGTTVNMNARMYRGYYCGKYYDRFRKKELVADVTLGPGDTKKLECVYEQEVTADYADCQLGPAMGPQTITLRTVYEKACIGKDGDPACLPGPTKLKKNLCPYVIPVQGFNASALATFDKLKDPTKYPVTAADLESEWLTKPSGCRRSDLTLTALADLKTITQGQLMNSGEECRIEGGQFSLDFVVKIPTQVEAVATFSNNEIEYTISNTGQQVSVEFKSSPTAATTTATVERITVRPTSAELDLRTDTGAVECLEVKF